VVSAPSLGRPRPAAGTPVLPIVTGGFGRLRHHWTQMSAESVHNPARKNAGNKRLSADVLDFQRVRLIAKGDANSFGIKLICFRTFL